MKKQKQNKKLGTPVMHIADKRSVRFEYYYFRYGFVWLRNVKRDNKNNSRNNCNKKKSQTPLSERYVFDIFQELFQILIVILSPVLLIVNLYFFKGLMAGPLSGSPFRENSEP